MGKNWKTTLAGAGFGVLNLFVGGGFTTPEGKINWQSLLLSAGMITMGAFAKDNNVTGGTVAQPTTVIPKIT